MGDKKERKKQWEDQRNERTMGRKKQWIKGTKEQRSKERKNNNETPMIDQRNERNNGSR
jgi:hypothetical protein